MISEVFYDGVDITAYWDMMPCTLIGTVLLCLYTEEFKHNLCFKVLRCWF